jgi:hypothetical protein
MTRIREIQKVYGAELALIQEQSSLLLQKRAGGFSGELKSSGAIVESYLKGLLSQHLPGGYRICSGFIATAQTIHEDAPLLQHDLIITDGRVPPIYKFSFGDIELIPAEAVCGVMEIKRTLTHDSLARAIGHLKSIYTILESYDSGIKSKLYASNKAAGPTLSVATRAPLYAIICLDSTMTESDLAKFKEQAGPAVYEFIDMIWAPAASILARFTIRSPDGEIIGPHHVSRSQAPNTPYCLVHWIGQGQKVLTYGCAVSFFRHWINNTSGVPMDGFRTQKYFGLS